MKIISGGQTGVDRAALDIALDLNLASGGWCPKGRLAEDGKIPNQYKLIETPSSDYAERTEWNVREADGTLILTFGKPSGGTALTIELSKKRNKPCLVIDLENPLPKEKVDHWIQTYQIRTLNVAGPRESLKPGVVYSTAFRFLKKILKQA